METTDCVTCGQPFAPYRSSQAACSRVCRDAQPHKVAKARERAAQPEAKARKNAARRVDGPRGTARRAANLRSSLSRYGLVLDEYERMVQDQNGACAICKERPGPEGRKAYSRLHVDHDHVTGKNRRLLCGRCNQGIGFMRDNPELLRAAAEYIQQHRR